MATSKNEPDHWRELAQLLGLPPEGAKASAGPSAGSKGPASGDEQARTEVNLPSAAPSAGEEALEGDNESEDDLPAISTDLEGETEQSGLDEDVASITAEDQVEDDALDEQTETDEIEESPGPIEEDDDDDIEVDHLKNWNVPSWNELIASLYRPDR